jgi:putative SOS response-associated peptidase YedK
MPVILAKKDEDVWLNEECTQPEQIASLIHPSADGDLKMYQVSKEVNSVRNNSADLLQPV